MILRILLKYSCHDYRVIHLILEKAEQIGKAVSIDFEDNVNKVIDI